MECWKKSDGRSQMEEVRWKKTDGEVVYRKLFEIPTNTPLLNLLTAAALPHCEVKRVGKIVI
jgi:hypothetical protein